MGSEEKDKTLFEDAQSSYMGDIFGTYAIVLCIILCVCMLPCCYLIFRCSWTHKGGWADTVFILLLSCILGTFTGGIGIVPLVLIIWFVSYLYGIEDWSCPISGKGGIKEMRTKKSGTKLISKSK